MVKPLLSSWFLEKNRSIFPSPCEGAEWGPWRSKQRSERFIWRMQCESVQSRIPVSGFGVKHTWVQIPALTFLSCVTLDKELPLSVPVSSSGKQQSSSTSHRGRGEGRTGPSMWKHSGWGWQMMANGFTSSCHWLLYCLQANNSFYLFKQVKNQKNILRHENYMTFKFLCP